MSYTIGVCEDELEHLKEIVRLVNGIAKENELQIKIETFSSLNRLESYMNDPLEKPLDLILLDIYFDEDETGVAFAKKLRELNDQTKIVFITSSPEFALEGYTIEPKAYILKPIDTALLEEAILRSLKDYRGNKILIKSPTKMITLDLDRILYFEINNKELTVHYDDSSFETIKLSLKEIKELLPENQFFQIHRSYIVSLPGIYAVQNREAVLLNKEKIPVSKKYYKELQEKLMEWYLEEGKN